MAKRKTRSAIVPAIVFSASLAVGAAVVPQIAGCDDDTTMQGVGLDVAYVGFDMARHDMSALTVANLGFDLSTND
jgi:hypothetical protein